MRKIMRNFSQTTLLFANFSIGLVGYEAYRTYSAVSNLVDTRVLDIDRKRPDYIYIKHHIYRQSLQEQLEQEKENSRLVNVVVQPFGKWWKALKHSVAWRLLKIAQEGEQSDRLKAIKQLALIDHLKGECRSDRTIIIQGSNIRLHRWYKRLQVS